MMQSKSGLQRFEVGCSLALGGSVLDPRMHRIAVLRSVKLNLHLIHSTVLEYAVPCFSLGIEASLL